MNKKRVWTLYRVSTKSQISNGEDIPMQEKACKDFIEKQDGWVLTNELKELGVSGWKNSTEDRDELLKIKEAASNNEFDVLLVFMLDRIGRRENESSLVVQFLIENGIEVWSVNEGQSKIEDHSDILINYIRFWQSAGESKKTSIRVTEAMKQLNEQGFYMGGVIPFGFRLIESDVPHPKKKGKNISKLVIDEDESKIVKLIFDLTLNKGFGGGRIAKYLNEQGYDNRGNIWRFNTITRMLKNPVYMGRKRYNTVDKNRKELPIDQWKLQPFNKDLAIVSEEEFIRTQEIIKKRTQVKDSEITTPTRSKLLLAGIATCGYCGHTLKADYTVKTYTRKTDGVTNKIIAPRYKCNHVRNFSKGHPRSSFGAVSYEEEVERIVINVISQLNLDSFIEEANNYKKENISQKMEQINKLNEQLQSKLRALDKLNDEIVKVLMGESKFTEARLNTVIDKTEYEIELIKEKIENLEIETKDNKLELSDIEYLKNEFKDWEVKYRNADVASKKMMLSRILKRVEFKDKEINIAFKLTIDRLLNVDNGMWKASNSEWNGMDSTLQDLINNHLQKQGLRHIEFDVEREFK